MNKYFSIISITFFTLIIVVSIFMLAKSTSSITQHSLSDSDDVCDKPCGPGHKYRTVYCSIDGTLNTKVDIENCKNVPNKPIDTSDCNLGPCGCDPSCPEGQSCVNGNCVPTGKYPSLGPPNDPSVLPVQMDMECNCPEKTSFENTGTLTFKDIIPENVYEMLFPFHNKLYTYKGLMDAIEKHPKGYLIGGEGTDDDRKRDVAAFFANIAHETGNGNGPSNQTTTMPVQEDVYGESGNGPWSSDQNYLFNNYGNKYFQCRCKNPEDCTNNTECPTSVCSGGVDPDSGNFWSYHTSGAGIYCGGPPDNAPGIPSGWLSGLICITEGCPEDPKAPGKEATNEYCSKNTDFIDNWNNTDAWKTSAWKNPPDSRPFKVYGGSNSSPCSPEKPCPCVIRDDGTHVKYIGRGPIQLSYDYNYGSFSWAMYDLGVTDDPYYISKNPELLSSDPMWVWLTAVHFWTLPAGNPAYKGLSSHDAMVIGSSQKGGGFGCAIQIVNNECEQYKEVYYKQPSSNAGNRVAWYRTFCDAFGIPIQAS